MEIIRRPLYHFNADTLSVTISRLLICGRMPGGAGRWLCKATKLLLPESKSRTSYGNERACFKVPLI